MTADDGHAIEYRSEDGWIVRVVVPWALGSGVIPPPQLTFADSETGDRLTFVYAGSP